MTWETAGQIATVMSPVVATTVFVVTIVLDRHRRARERLSVAADRARAELLNSIGRSVLPGVMHLFGIGVTRPFYAITALALCVPRKYGSVSVWLAEGARIVSVGSHVQDRIDALQSLDRVVVLLASDDRRALKKAAEYVSVNPWRAVEVGTPESLARWLKPVKLAIGILTGDPTYR